MTPTIKIISFGLIIPRATNSEMWNTSGPKIRDIQITCLFVWALDWDLNFTYFFKNYFMFLHVWSMNSVWVEVRGQFTNSSLPPLWVPGTDLRLEKQVTLPGDHLTGAYILFIARDQGSYEWTASFTNKPFHKQN